MPRGKPRGRRETGDVVKWQIIELWEAGVKNKSEIARRLHLSWTAVNLWVQRWESEGHLNVRPRSGRPRTTSGDDETTVNTYTAFYGPGGAPPKPAVQVKLERPDERLSAHHHHHQPPSFAAAASVAAATSGCEATDPSAANGPLPLLPLRQLSDPTCFANHQSAFKRSFENGGDPHHPAERHEEVVGLDPPPPQRLSLATQTDGSSTTPPSEMAG
ncbi:uncharacterized protein LOC142576467 [Dermacentor variabilis]|uniref:uncharacterized protein LOC142576467 n=1 Tax=Dermacentor variabilis TaxID=34621 RepID=UPI003F5B775E